VKTGNAKLVTLDTTPVDAKNNTSTWGSCGSVNNIAAEAQRATYVIYIH